METETPQRGVSTKKGSRLKPNSLGAIIGQLKSSCTKRIWATGNRDFSWQSRFYDHIIRDEHSLNTIREYIINNPIKWALDKDNPENLFM
jgi:putative transposase